jgi:TRAP-type C4-dicarboxylate transport system permease small subunit
MPRQKKQPKKIWDFVKGISELLKSLPDALDWLVRVMERIIVLGIACAILFVGFQVLAGKQIQPEEKSALTKMAENWRIIFVVLVPLFYLTIRTFIEEIVEAFGVKRKKKELIPPRQEEEEEDVRPSEKV